MWPIESSQRWEGTETNAQSHTGRGGSVNRITEEIIVYVFRGRHDAFECSLTVLLILSFLPVE